MHKDGLGPNWGQLETVYRWVRNRRPLKCIEYGSGWSTAVIGQALKDNRRGGLVSFDNNRNWLDQTARLVDDLPVALRCVELAQGDFADVKAWRYVHVRERADFVLLDGPTLSNERKICVNPLLDIEWQPGWSMLVDKRYDNARFLAGQMDAGTLADEELTLFWG